MDMMRAQPVSLNVQVLTESFMDWSVGVTVSNYSEYNDYYSSRLTCILDMNLRS